MNDLNHTRDTIMNYTDLGPLTTNSFGDRYFYRLNRGSFDKVSAHALYEAKLSDALFKAHTLTVIIGTDSGLLPQYVLQKGLPNGSRYIFIEPEDILAQLVTHDLLANLPPEIACVSPEKWEEQAEIFKVADYFYINAVHSQNSICAQEASFEEYPELSWLIAEKLNQLFWSHTMTLGREGFIVSQMHNLADNRLPARLLKDAFKGQTAVILAGGPSLDEALPWVKQNRDRFAVFAVSRVARQLQQAKIEPDFICAVDPNEFSFDVSKEMLNFGENTTFVYAYHTAPRLVQQWSGKALYLGTRLPWKSALNLNNIDGAGPTVTNTTISTAFEFGFSRIILAGVDLCFTRDGYTHAQGSDEALSGPRFNLTSLQIETNGGEMAPTSYDFLSAVNTLSFQAKILTHKQCKLINPSANAAKIAHVDHVPYTEIELPDLTLNINQQVEQHLQQAQKQRANDKALLLRELKHAQHQITAIQNLSESALNINDNMYNAEGIIENYHDKRKLDKIEQQLKRQYRKFSVAVKNLGIRQFIKVVRPFDDIDMTADDAKDLCKVYYTAYRDGAKKFLDLIADATARIEARLEEQQPQPDFEKLLAQWQKDQSFGRAQLWQKTFNNPTPNNIAAKFNDYTEKLQAIIADKNTGHLARAKSFSSLQTFKNRAKSLYKHGKLSELKDLKAGLDKYPNPQDAVGCQQLATGYIADLEGDTNKALEAYQAVIDGGQKNLYEDALLRIADISIKHENHDNLYLALQCLSQLSPTHLPLYAEVNRLLGNAQEALDIYYDYINRFPSDTLVQLKLAALHIETQSYAAADLMLDYILSGAPHSKAAIELKKQTHAFITAAKNSKNDIHDSVN